MTQHGETGVEAWRVSYLVVCMYWCSPSRQAWVASRRRTGGQGGQPCPSQFSVHAEGATCFAPSSVGLTCSLSQALSVGIFPYVLKLLQSSARELRPLLVFIWAKILAVDSVSNICVPPLPQESC